MPAGINPKKGQVDFSLSLARWRGLTSDPCKAGLSPPYWKKGPGKGYVHFFATRADVCHDTLVHGIAALQPGNRAFGTLQSRRIGSKVLMMGAIKWKADALVSLKLRDDLYTIAQLKKSSFIWCFDIHNSSGEWEGVDLNLVEPLFCVVVARIALRHMAAEKVERGVIPPANLPIPSQWLRANQNPSCATTPGNVSFEKFPWRNATLVNDYPERGPTRASVIKPELDVEADRAIIESCELDNMWGPDDLGDRLRRYFDAGINRDDLKFAIFPGLWNDAEKLRPLTRRLPAPLR